MNVAHVLGHLGGIAARRKEHERAAALFTESLAACRSIAHPGKMHTGYYLVGLGAALQMTGRPRRTVTLYGAASRIFDELGNWGGVELDLDDLRATLGEAAFAAAWEEGRALSLEQALDYALADDLTEADS